MSRKGRKNSSRGFGKNGHALEGLEDRRMLAAHILGNSTVYATLQAAVNAATPGAVINVDAGSYAELVTINKTLTIRGAEAGVDARTNARAGANNESVITGMTMSDGTVSAAFYIAANDVTIDGFTVQGNTSNSTYGAGIVIAPNEHGTHILNNIVQNNVSGMFLANNSATDAAIIQHNVFRNNNNAGANGGRGIYTDGGISGGNLTNVLIDGNAFYGNHGGSGTTTYEAAIAFESRTLNSQSNFTITNNTFDSNGKAVLFYNASGAVIENNVVTHETDQWSGAIRFEGGMSNVQIEYNTVYSSTGPAVRVDEKGFTGDNFNFTVTNNNFYGNSSAYTTKESVIVGAGQYDGTFDARNNYWGDPSGPSGSGTGTGDALTANGNAVLYSPWASSPVVGLDTPYWGIAATDGAPIQSEDFDSGGEGVGYHDTTTADSGNQYRTGSGVDIETTGDTGGGYDVGWTAAGEWMGYTVNLSATGTYRLDMRVASQAAGGSYHVEVDGVNVTGAITMPNTGGYQTWKTLTVNGLALTGGQHFVKFVFDKVSTNGTAGNFNWFELTNTTAAATPAAASGLYAVMNGPASVTLGWVDNSTNETGFAIDRMSGVNGTLVNVGTTAADETGWTDTTTVPGGTYTYRVRATNLAGSSAASNTVVISVPTIGAVTYLSDMPFVGTPTNGWGPVERDMSNGGQNAGDGNTITLHGVTYAKGLGVNSPSSITFELAGEYGTFTSDVGIDDEEIGKGIGTVDFQVFADGVLIADSGLITSNSPTKTMSVSVAGVQQLTLVVTDGGDGSNYDHADWAGAELSAGSGVATAPAAPTALTAAAATGQISLAWMDNSTNETGFNVERSTDGKTFTQISSLAAGTTSFSDMTAVAGTTYYYRVDAFNGVGTSAYTNVAGALIAPVLPAAWSQADIGTVAAGSATYVAGTYTVNGAGTVGGTADSMHFVYQSLTGNGTIIARVNSVASGMAGLMIRETLAAGAKEVSFLETPTSGGNFMKRTATGGATTIANKAGTLPRWQKLVRSGTTITAYKSSDGVTWTQVGTTTVSMASVVYVGLAVESGAGTTLSQAVMDNVSVVAG